MNVTTRNLFAGLSVTGRARIMAAALSLVFFSLAIPDVPARAETELSTDGLYRIAYSSELVPLAINQLHRWTLTLTDADGVPVESATFVVTGGMPEHNHGLPTQPEVTRYLGDGQYLLEGMRFHMQGFWQLTIAVDSPLGRDTVVLNLSIDR